MTSPTGFVRGGGSPISLIVPMIVPIIVPIVTVILGVAIALGTVLRSSQAGHGAIADLKGIARLGSGNLFGMPNQRENPGS